MHSAAARLPAAQHWRLVFQAVKRTCWCLQRWTLFIIDYSLSPESLKKTVSSQFPRAQSGISNWLLMSDQDSETPQTLHVDSVKLKRSRRLWRSRSRRLHQRRPYITQSVARQPTFDPGRSSARMLCTSLLHSEPEWRWKRIQSKQLLFTPHKLLFAFWLL